METRKHGSAWFLDPGSQSGSQYWPRQLAYMPWLPSLQAYIFVSVKPSPFLMVLEPQITSIVNFDECVEAYHMAQSDKLDYQMLY